MNLDSCEIHLNSKYGQSKNSYLSDIDFQLPIIEVPDQHYIHLSVLHAVIPYSFYNVDNTNNVLYIQQTTGVSTYIYQTIIIPSGNYNAYQLQQFLNTNISNTTTTYNVITNKFTFVNSLYNFYIDVNISTCLNLLGFTVSNTYTTSLLKTLTSNNCVNLLTKMCVCIVSEFNSLSFNNSNPYSSNVLCSIPINTPPYSLINYQNNSNHRINTYNNNINSINIKLIDQQGNLLNLNGGYFSLTLMISSIPFGNEN